MKQLRDCRQGIAAVEHRRRDTNEGADVPDEAVAIGAVAIDVRLGLRPGAVEERDEAMVKDVQEPAERRVAGIPQPFPRVFREMKRERAVGSEQPEQPDLQPRGTPVDPVFQRRQRRGGEGQLRILSEPHPLVNRPQRFAPPRLGVVQAFQPPQCLIEIEAVRRRRQFGEEGYSVGFAPGCGTHRLISPRLTDRRIVSVKELIVT